MYLFQNRGQSQSKGVPRAGGNKSNGSAVPSGLRRNGMIRKKGFYPSLWSFVPSGLSQEGSTLTSGATL